MNIDENMLNIQYIGLEGQAVFDNLLRTFFERHEIVYVDCPPTFGLLLQLIVSKSEEGVSVSAVLSENGTVKHRSEQRISHRPSAKEMKRLQSHAVKTSIYDALQTVRKSKSPWGILVGVRPVKLVHELLDQGMAISDIRDQLRADYRIQDEKIDLITNIAQRERPFLFPVDESTVSIYLCMPFCPSRCLYCSFPSNSLEKKAHLVRPYLDALLHEIREVGTLLEEMGRTVDCIYFGGGTPTSMTSSELNEVMYALTSDLPIRSLREFTVEAGRPDTLDREKLTVLRNFGVDRICINPQTMCDETLLRIGRAHGSKDIEAIYELAKSIGFKTINMDLIIGLPGEGDAHIRDTMDAVIALRPENVTIHTLAVKRSSQLKSELAQHKLGEQNTIESMMAIATTSMDHVGMIPYYMYRQKNILANLENIGYAMPGHESLYNMRIMEERHTILALGAGSVSKLYLSSENTFERVANSKGIEDYIARVDEMIEKKRMFYNPPVDRD